MTKERCSRCGNVRRRNAQGVCSPCAAVLSASARREARLAQEPPPAVPHVDPAGLYERKGGITRVRLV